MDWQGEYQKRLASIEEMAQKVQSGDVIGIGLGLGGCSSDIHEAILDRNAELENVFIIDAVQVRRSKLYDPKFMASIDGRINYISGFGTAPVRNINREKVAGFLPIMTIDAYEKLAERSDIFIAQVTPPNKNGFVNLGLSNFYTMDAIRLGKKKGKLRLAVAEVNDQMPVIYGNNWMHITEFDCFVENSTPLPIIQREKSSEIEKAIGEYCLELINDGDTIQMGIGGISEAVVAGLEGRKELGVLTEMFPIGLPQLVEKGIVTNSQKPFHKGVTVATFCMGDKDMYDYVAENPSCEFYPASYTNNPAFIAQHPNMKAINMAIMVDLTGQIASEGIGDRMVSGTGGQLDFMIGSYWSSGGAGITLVSSARKAADGSLIPSIVPELPAGTPVTVPRHYAHYVVTEYGIANLRFKTVRERAKELISVAHPDLRSELRESLKTKFYPQVALDKSNDELK